MECEGLIERPAVLKRMETTRCHVDGLRQICRLAKSHPRIVRPGIEGGNDGIGHRPGLLMPPHETGPSWTEHPLVCPGDQEITAYVGKAEIFDSQRMDSVHAKDRP